MQWSFDVLSRCRWRWWMRVALLAHRDEKIRDKMAVRIATTVGMAVPQGRALKGLRLPQWVFDEDFWDWEHPVFADVLTFISLIAETV